MEDTTLILKLFNLTSYYCTTLFQIQRLIEIISVQYLSSLQTGFINQVDEPEQLMRPDYSQLYICNNIFEFPTNYA